MNALSPKLSPLDVDTLKKQFREAEPFPSIVIDNFLEPEFAQTVAAAYPSFEEAAANGMVFESVNEHLKLQLTDASLFPTPIKELADIVNSDAFTSTLSQITGIPNLLADPNFGGGGIHQTGPSGRLDVHVDFNYLHDQQWHRRLNILIYLNPIWEQAWGGALELWDQRVKTCYHTIEPVMNRCVIFETSDISFHGVTQVTCANDMVRRSFAGYYYTREAPAHWTGKAHGTIFKARPSELSKGLLKMPMEKGLNRAKKMSNVIKSKVKRAIHR